MVSLKVCVETATEIVAMTKKHITSAGKVEMNEMLEIVKVCTFGVTKMFYRRGILLVLAASIGLSVGCVNERFSGFADSDGHRIYYEVYGEGEPIILVHGWSMSILYNWKLTGWIRALQSVREVIALDIRGHGESDKPYEQEAYSYATMAQDVLSVMDHLDIARADLLGYSLGAFSGVHLLGHNQERFNSVIMMGIGDEDEESLALAPVIANALRAEDLSQITDPEGLWWRILVSIDPRNDLEALALSALQMWPEGFPLQLGGPGLSNVVIPVLIINGENDVPYVYTDQNLAAAIPGAMLVEIPDSGHLGVLFDSRFKDEVLNFLADQ
jgi:pimeloyl-ACP methyl ester carboxylesterase